MSGNTNAEEQCLQAQSTKMNMREPRRVAKSANPGPDPVRQFCSACVVVTMVLEM
jgi:hypothetical protein